MTNTWILDVLTDLKAFADLNGLPDLSRRLDETVATAEAELASSDREFTGPGDDGKAFPRNGPGGLALC